MGQLEKILLPYVALVFLIFCGLCTSTLVNSTLNISQNSTIANFTSFTETCCDNLSVSSEDNLSITRVLNSWWEEISRENLKHSVSYTVLIVVVYLVVFWLGIVGNGFVILVIALRPRMRTVTNLFLLNLAVSDVFLLMVCLPPTLLANVLKSWILGLTFCKGVTYIQGVSVIASAYSLVAITIDRFKKICQHSIFARGFSRKQAVLVIALIWLYSVVLPLPWTLVYELHTSQEDNYTYCFDNWGDSNLDKVYFVLVTLFFSYLFPAILISLANFLIWWIVSHRTVVQACTSSSPCANILMQRVHRRTQQGVGRMLGIVTFTFLISWLPLYILGTEMKFSTSFSTREKQVLSVLVPLAQWLGYWNSCINPVLYAFYNTTFRTMYKSILPSWLFQRNGVRVQQKRKALHRRSRSVFQQLQALEVVNNNNRRQVSQSSHGTLQQRVVMINGEVHGEKEKSSEHFSTAV